MDKPVPIAIDDVVKRIQDLPSLSTVVLELLASMEQEDVDLQVLAAKISLDQSLAAKTLRLANSSFYGMSTKVTTIQQAISILGFHHIRTLVTACAVTGSFPETAGGGFDFRAFWRHSVATAVCARQLAPYLKCSADIAFTVGLLHDIGALVLATRYPQRYEEMLAYRRAHDCYVVEAEQAVFGIDHALVGSALAAYWKFPASMQSAVAGHHRRPDPKQAGLALLVHAADTLAHALDLSGLEDDLVPPLDLDSWNALALSEADSTALFAQSEAIFHDMCQILVN